MRIAVIGTGYVGLVSGACLADKGHEVVCVDQDAAKLARIEAGDAPIHERGLEALLQRHLGGRLRVSGDLAGAVGRSELSLLTVGTPFDGKAIDVRYVRAASGEVGRALRRCDGFHTVVVKSTVVPGTTDGVVRPLLEQASGKRAGVEFGVGMNPEFLREGSAVADFMDPDRIVYGASDPRALAALDELYAVFPGVDVVRTTNKTAEMIKYTANCLLATLISFSNELANLASELGELDFVEVMRAVHLDRRLSPRLEDGRRLVPGVTSYLEAGCGFGGGCLPKDLKALIAHGRQAGQPMELLRSVSRINESQPGRLTALLKRHFESLRGCRVAVLGLAFKPGTSDMRETPAVPLIRSLDREGASIVAYDPAANEEARGWLSDVAIDYAASLEEAVRDAEAVVIVTAWPEFSKLGQIVSAMASPPLVVDGRRMLERRAFPRYEGIGL